MRQYILTLLRLILFWLGFFVIGRVLFLCVYAHLLSNVAFGDLVLCFLHALRLDISTICYLCALPILLLSLNLYFNTRFLDVLLKICVAIELIVCLLILIGEIAVYGEWLCKLNYKILLYLKRPMEIIKTATPVQLLASVVAIVLLFVGLFFIFSKWVITNRGKAISQAYWKVPLIFLLSGGLCFLGMRGGFDAIPITQSAAYYSSNSILNDCAVNPYWNLFCSFYDFGCIDENRYHFMEDKEAEMIVENIRKPEKDTTVSILTRKNVNIVFILLESWTSDLVESISSCPGISDNFHELEKGGILFTEMYTNGHRSQQAMSSIFSGFPALPMYDITDDFSKYKNLPSLSNTLKQSAYHTSFYFGGNLDYGNIRSFLLHCNFDKIVEEKNMDRKLPRGKLGIHDQYTFALHHKALNSEKQPFMSVLFTLSSHSPYDQPKNSEVGTVDIKHEETPFLNSAKYCDYYLGRYFDSVREEPWYKNTLFVILGDHGHPTQFEKVRLTAEYQHIPLLFYGEVIPENLRGTKISRICSQVDIVFSILKQLGLENSDFCWGKDLFNPYSSQFAYFEAADGFGWIRPQASVVNYKSGNSRIFYGSGDSTYYETLDREGKAYLQYLYKTYIEY